MITKKSGRKIIEQTALNLIMNQQNKFSVKTIILALRAVCDEDIANEEVADTVFNAIEFCLSIGYIEIINDFGYMVNPVKQIEYVKENNETILI